MSIPDNLPFYLDVFGGGLRSDMLEGGGAGSGGRMGGHPISVFSHASSLPVRNEKKSSISLISKQKPINLFKL